MKYLKTENTIEKTKKYEISDLEFLIYITISFLLGILIGSYATLLNLFTKVIT